MVRGADALGHAEGLAQKLDRAGLQAQALCAVRPGVVSLFYEAPGGTSGEPFVPPQKSDALIEELSLRRASHTVYALLGLSSG